VIWAVLDPANPFIAPASAPFVIGLVSSNVQYFPFSSQKKNWDIADRITFQAYANMVWGFANVTISTNLARDLGTRIVAAIFFGGDAFNRYAPIAIFVNIPATIFATFVYEVLLKDSFAIIAKGHNVHEEGDEGLARHLTKTGTLEEGITNNIARRDDHNGTYQNGKIEGSLV
jgi:hypothetical protein